MNGPQGRIFDEVAAVDPTRREDRSRILLWGEVIHLEGAIGPTCDLSAANVRAALAALRRSRSINVRVDCEGGEVAEGLAIYTAFRESRVPVNVTVDGRAASMAAIVIAGASEVAITRGSTIMIHEPWCGFVSGGAPDFRRKADELDRQKAIGLDILVRRTRIDRKELAILMRAETTFSAEEAVERGFADRIVPALATPASCSNPACPLAGVP